LKTKKYRHELKYMITTRQYEVLSRRLKNMMDTDDHAGEDNKYHVRSLYFDNPYNRCLNEKLAGIYRRDKYRIRLYNHDSGLIRLERKMKLGQMTRKESLRLSKEECQSILNGRYRLLLEKDNITAHNFFKELTINAYRAAVLIDYRREAFVKKEGNVRVTFDSNLRSGSFRKDIFNKNIPTIPLIESKWIIMEIKYDEFLPESIAGVVRHRGSRRLSVSKYVLGRKPVSLSAWEDS